MEALNLFEIGILDAIQTLRCGFLDVFFPIVTLFGDGGVFWIAFAAFLLIFKKTRKTGLMMGAALLMGFCVCNLFLKPVIGRIRPYELNPDIVLLVKRLTDGSFPSGHTLASFEASVVLMIRDRRMGIPALVLAILIAFSRMYLYMHYPTDVLGGMLLGILFAVLGVWIVDALTKKYDKNHILG